MSAVEIENLNHIISKKQVLKKINFSLKKR